MIPFGPHHPDAAGINTSVVREARNVLPDKIGFRPIRQPVASTDALDDTCRGSVSIILDDGSVQTFAGTQDALYQLNATAGWDDVTETSETYAVGSGEQWKFALYGPNLLATNITDGIQKFELGVSTEFEPLGGSPPAARYIDIMREFVVIGAIASNEKRVQWCANGNSESWTPGTGESDYQDFPNGGPVRGIVGGETSYVFQAERVTRMSYVPGSPEIMQFDQVEGAAGLSAPHSLVRLRSDAYYLAPDGLRKFSLLGGASDPIGVGKWAKWFLADKKQGADLSVLGAANPSQPLIVWAYVSSSNSGVIPDRLLIYDWSLDEATFADISVNALVQWLSPGVTLDTMNGYGNMETLPFSLDSPFWRGGSQLLGLFGADDALSLLSGSNMQATLITADGQAAGRQLIKGTRPLIDTTLTTVAVDMREADGDAVAFPAQEAMEDTGICPAHQSGNIARARLIVPAGATWSLAKGIETVATRMGRR